MHHDQRSVAVFKWDGELPTHDVESDPERLTTLIAKAPAEAIHSALRSRGYRTNVDTPYDGEGGWDFVVETAGRTFGIFTLWTGIADQDYFAVQTDLKRGVLAALFRKPVQDERLEPICAIPQSRGQRRLDQRRWLTPHYNGLAGRNGRCDSNAARRPAGG
jgi:hypothetical protein